MQTTRYQDAKRFCLSVKEQIKRNIIMEKSLFNNRFSPSLLGVTVALACSTASAQPQTEGLEHIEVNAQKRTQSLQEVPVAVTALSGEDLADTVSRDLFDIQQYVPAFAAFQSQSATNSSFSIRGIGTSSQNFGFESSVGLYVDGVYRSRQNAVINDMVDINAIEILRGPQGTLFGKNTPAGAVVINTLAPSHDESNGFASATAGTDSLLRFAAGSSFTAIEDTLSFRVTGFSTQRDGWIDDIGSGTTLNNRDRSGARLQVLYTPSDKLSLRVIADYAELDERCCGALTWQDNQQANEIPGKFGTDALLMMPPFSATLYTRENFYDYETALSVPPRSTMTDRGISAQLDYVLSDSLSLVSISAWRGFDSLDIVDTDFTNADLLMTSNDARQQSFSQEVRLHVDKARVSGLIGAYYFTQNLDLDFAITTQDQFPFFFAASAAELAPLIDGINAVSAVTQGVIPPAAPAAPGNTAFAHSADQQQDSIALFAQADWMLTDSLTLTTGVRYTHEDKTLSGQYTEDGPGINGLPTAPDAIPNPLAAGMALQNIGAALASGMFPGQSDLAAIAPFQQPGWGYFFLGTASVLPRPDLNKSISDAQWTGSVKLAWQLHDDQMWYLSGATGYKAGGLNTDRIATGFDPVFDAETATSVEIGVKQQWDQYNLRLNVAAHTTQIRDFQASTFTGTGFNLQNAGDINVNGFEVEVTWLPFANTELSLNMARTHAEFDKFERGTCWTSYPWHTGMGDPGRPAEGVPYCSKAGNRVGFEPELAGSATLSQYFDIGAYPSRLSVDYQYVGDVFLDDSNDPYKYSPSYQLVNLRWMITLPEWETDITLWGRNILDKEYAARSGFDVPVQTGKIMAYPGQPASWGVTVQTYF